MKKLLKKRRFWLTLVIFLLIGSVCSPFVFKKKSYNTVAARRGEIVEAIYGLGKVKTHQSFDLKIAISSSVSRFFVHEGQKIKKNDPLARLDKSRLFRSPINGTVTAINVHEAELIAPQSVILSIENLQTRYIEVALEQKGALRTKVGQKAHVLFESLRAKKFEGTVSAVFSKKDEFLTQIEVKGLRENILPGMTADVAIEVTRNDKALLVPRSSLNQGRVIVLVDNKPRKVKVVAGAIDEAWVEIIEGNINVGDPIVIPKKLNQ